ncbi:MAG TPA: DUF2950 domain-containing protein [Pyrinomonadaceae bacterium]|nr:DUF2950 domain-containing protein [Pyrinomonadaceae bacterium]
MNIDKSIANSTTLNLLWQRLLTTVMAAVLLLALAPAAGAQEKSTPGGKAFATPEEAANSLIDAAEKYDESALMDVLGPDSYDIIHTGERARDSEKLKEFAAQARTKMSVEVNKQKNSATMVIGNEDWPFPLPIVKAGTSWFFDTRSGRREILLRRIGRNELDAIEICRGYVEAQHEYALRKRVGYEVNQYAQRIISTPGQKDGLAWKNADGTWDGPIGEKVAAAIALGYQNRTEPYHGYYFKVLKGQGPAAPLGELDYVLKGVMIGGFALIASPAQYKNTGVKSFMVSQDGVVYEKDLGPLTLEFFKNMERFNPDKSWSPVLQPLDYEVKPGE